MKEIVVSLTSFPAAIEYAILAVKSILRGKLLPDKLVLYLTFEQFRECGIPEELLKLEKENDVFEIRDYPIDIRSYRKLIPALKDFPESIIVTVDDDVDYDENMLKDMISMHKLYPEAVIANRAKVADISKPYKKWKKLRWYDFIGRSIKIDPHIIQTGVGGVLYPPHSLKEEMIDESLFVKLAPTTDDIWFWAAAISNGKTIIPMPYGRHNKPKELGKPRNLSLKMVNFKNGTSSNDEAVKVILAYYPEIKKILTK